MFGKIKKMGNKGSKGIGKHERTEIIAQVRHTIQRTTTSNERANLANQFQRASTINVDEVLAPLMRKHKVFVTNVQKGELVAVIRILTGGKVGINEVLDSTSKLTPIHLAAMLKKTDILNSMLRSTEIEVNALTRDGDTPLLLALKACGSSGDELDACLQTVKMLLEDRRCQIGRVNAVGASPLSVAVAKGQRAIVHMLVSANRIRVYAPIDLAMAIKLAFIYDRDDLVDLIFNEMDVDSKHGFVALLEQNSDLKSLARHLQDEMNTRQEVRSAAPPLPLNSPPPPPARENIQARGGALYEFFSPSMDESRQASGADADEETDHDTLTPQRSGGDNGGMARKQENLAAPPKGAHGGLSPGRTPSPSTTQISQDGGYGSEPALQDLGRFSNSSAAAIAKAKRSGSMASILSEGSTSSCDGSGLQLIPRRDLEMKRKLGSGGFGCVTVGSWRGADCAIKQIRPIVTSDIDYEEILKEARIQYGLKHPNIVTLYGISYEQDLWMVMQLVDGMDLHSILFGRDRNGNKEKVAYSFKVKIAVQTTNAIRYMHEKGFLHNDIKPENIMIEKKTGNVLVCDFGITRYLGKTDLRTYSQKYTDAYGGTLPYIAPECFQRDPVERRYLRPTFKSDVWALGAVFIELFTEKEIFPTEKALFQCKIMKDYSGVKASLRGVTDPTVRDLLKKAIDPEPDVRPTAEDMNTVLFDIMRQKPQ